MTLDPRRAAQLDRLPLPYSTALRLRDAGVCDELIAECLGVQLDVFPLFMRMAVAKLRAAERGDRTS